MKPMASRRTRLLLISVVTVLVVAAGMALGLWQLGRAEQKLRLADGIARQGALAPLAATELQTDRPETLWHRTAQLEGEWLPEASVFLDNRQMKGRVGFFVLTPLKLANGQGTLLVQRGWAPRNFQDRQRVPMVPTPTGPVALQLRLAPPPPKLYELGPGEGGAIRQNVDLAAYGAEIKTPLLPLSALQTSAADDGLLRDWPQPATDVHKHYGYAFQWFGLSTLFALLYVWFQIIAPRRRARTQSAG
jgi:surfeit locus 1 family protein